MISCILISCLFNNVLVLEGEVDCVLCLAVTIFEVAEARAGDKRKREKPGDPGDIEGYKGEVNKETKM